MKKLVPRKFSLTAITTMASMLAMSVNTVFAANANIFTEAENLLKQAYNGILGLVYIIGGLALLLCLVMMLFASDERKVAGARRWALTIVFVLILITLIPMIINWAAGFGKGQKLTNQFNGTVG